MRKTWLMLVMVMPLAACGAGTATETRVQTQYVPVRAPCPDKRTYDGLKSTRPKPLAGTAMPDSAQERADKQFAQLGRFEAPGAWADRAEAALDRCQDGQEPVGPPSGVAPSK